ncbi:unnamed protein product, partial [Ectocarpus fasciculatus]
PPSHRYYSTTTTTTTTTTMPTNPDNKNNNNIEANVRFGKTRRDSGSVSATGWLIYTKSGSSSFSLQCHSRTPPPKHTSIRQADNAWRCPMHGKSAPPPPPLARSLARSLTNE